MGKKGMKRIFCIFTVLVILCTSIPVQAMDSGTAGGRTENGFGYTVHGNQVTVTGYTGDEKEVAIPETISGKQVTAVWYDKSWAQQVTTIVLSRYVQDCQEIGAANIEEIRTVEANPYLTAKDGVLYTKDLSRVLLYPYGKKDKEYRMPNEVERDCDEKGEGKANLDNPYLEKITYSSNPKYTAVHVPYWYSGGNLKMLVLPDNITELGDQLFYRETIYEDSIKELTIKGNNLKRIGNGICCNCRDLTKIMLPDSVEEIGRKAFYQCINLKKITLPQHLKKIGARSFRGCTEIKTIRIPDSVQKIGSNAFFLCKATIKMPAYLKKKVSRIRRDDGKKRVYTAMAAVQNANRKKETLYLAKKITQIKAAKKKIRIQKVDTQNLQTMVYISGRKAGTLNSNLLKFSSSNKKVVTVTKRGKIKAGREGTARVTVTLRTTGETNKVKVEVK